MEGFRIRSKGLFESADAGTACRRREEALKL
jgi:hypothetical protein